MSLAKQIRLEKGKTLEEVARVLSINAGYLSQIENGQRQISANRAEEIAKVYNKKVEDIFLPTRYAVREVL